MDREENLKHFKIMSIDTITQQAMCNLGHRVSHQLLPTPILTIFDSHGRKKHIAIQQETDTSQTSKGTRTQSSTGVFFVKVFWSLVDYQMY